MEIEASCVRSSLRISIRFPIKNENGWMEDVFAINEYQQGSEENCERIQFVIRLSLSF